MMNDGKIGGKKIRRATIFKMDLEDNDPFLSILAIPTFCCGCVPI
jgi:hypothetical protein